MLGARGSAGKTCDSVMLGARGSAGKTCDSVMLGARGSAGKRESEADSSVLEAGRPGGWGRAALCVYRAEDPPGWTSLPWVVSSGAVVLCSSPEQSAAGKPLVEWVRGEPWWPSLLCGRSRILSLGEGEEQKFPPRISGGWRYKVKAPASPGPPGCVLQAGGHWRLQEASCVTCLDPLHWEETWSQVTFQHYHISNAWVLEGTYSNLSSQVQAGAGGP
ncbi:uncharacterized protein LOC101179179 [Nomascus leucogenys]|uniref:uncharacterized protein LOC101179179 n=1 Tax=Nomascus leucogenys TaxID=61853 RepID=UPI00122DB6A7|nr:uncharacterized protein LOC101179179 [Nomascus leucogenys]